MKKIILVIAICFMAQLSFAATYALFDKETGECRGTASINEDYVADWAKNYILKEADSSYQGKQGYEVKLEGGKLKHATKGEIDAYIAAQEQASQDAVNAKRKQELLDLLNDEDVGIKIKDISKP